MDIVTNRILLSEVDGGPLPSISHKGLYEILIETRFAQFASNNAIISMHQTSDLLATKTKDQSAPVTWTYGQLTTAARALAARLRQLGHRDEDKLVVILPNQIEWGLLFCTAVILGTTMVPLFPNVLTNPTEAEHMFKTIGSATIFVKNTRIAETVEKCLPTQYNNLKLKCLVDNDGQQTKSSWLSLKELVHSLPPAADSASVKPTSSFSLILFTSGTTSLPKACLVTEQMLLAALMMENSEYAPNDRFCLPLPSNHIFGVDIVLWMWESGGCVVYPSIAFTAESTLHALEAARCTHMALVPTMLHAIIEHPNRANTDLTNLKNIVVGAAPLPKSLIERAMSKEDGLGIQRLLHGYGMTEANYAIFSTGFSSIPILNGQVRTGTVVAGGKARICKPGTRELVPRGQRGDLHNGGSRVVHGYLNADSSCFYQDELDSDTWWICSGDQAEMDENGTITVLGRYKDLIIRGGENISPASIETLLDSVEGVKSQVVGYPDEVAGEVPVYVIWTDDAQPTPSDMMLELVRKRMGTRYSPKAILHIKHDLGLNIWPTTSSGKPKKAEIKILVKRFLDARNDGEVQDENTVRHVAQIWANLSGMEVDFLLNNQHDLNEFADSLMLMQFVSLVKKRMRKVITVSDLASNPTLIAQAKMIDSLPVISGTSNIDESKPGAPQLEDMVHCRDKSDVASTIHAAEEVIRPFGFSWSEDVEAICSTYDFGSILLRKLRPQSWNHRHEYVTSQANATELRTALEFMLANQPMLRTFGVQLSASQGVSSSVDAALEGGGLLHDGNVAHVVVRPSKRYYDLVIREGFEVDRPEDLYKLVLNDEILDHAAYPGPLVRFCLVKIITTGTAGLLLQGNHSVFDATSMSFVEDLNQILEHGMSTVQPHASYKKFTDLYYLHRKGPAAIKDATFFANRLSGIDQVAKNASLWPRQLAPEWFHGNFSTWYHSDGRPGNPDERLILDQEENKVGVTGVAQSAHLPGLAILRSLHNIPPSMVMKSACAIFNIRHALTTNGTENQLSKNQNEATATSSAPATEAIFTSTIAARKWPFEADYTSEERTNLPDIMDVAGPCVECVINRIPVSPDETAISFMTMVQRLQDLDTIHAHAPLSLIRTLMKPDDAKELIPLLRRQAFNWLPMILTSDDEEQVDIAAGKQVVDVSTAQNQTKTQTRKTEQPPIKLMRFTGRDDFGVRWNASLIDDHEHVQLRATYDDAQLRKAEMQENVAEFLRIAAWLSDEGNWGRKLSEMIL